MYINGWPLRRSGAGFLAVVIGALGFTGWAGATPLIDAAFAGSYSASDVTLPTSLAAESIAMTFKAGDPNTLLIGGRYPIGAGGKYQSAIYSVPVVRGGDGHVSGFGTPTMFAAAPGPTDVDALYPGLAYGPGGTLFYTYVEGTNTGLGEILPGGTQPAKFATLGQFAFTERALGLAFVPNWSTGSGQLKVTSATGSGGRWYDVSLVSLGDGTYDIGTAVQQRPARAPSPAAMVYVAGGNPGFATDSILVSDETTGQMIAYSVDGNGDILAGPAPLFATLDGASGDRWGGASDPLTGDVMVLASDHVAEFRGFAVPEPTGLAAAGAVLALVGARRGRRRRQS